MDSDLGRLVRTLKDRCGECNFPMQLRARKIVSLVRGVENEAEEEYKVCSNCQLEVEIPLKERKKRVEHFDKTAYVKEPLENNKRDNNARYKKPERPAKNDGSKSWGSPRKSSR